VEAAFFNGKDLATDILLVDLNPEKLKELSSVAYTRLCSVAYAASWLTRLMR